MTMKRECPVVPELDGYALEHSGLQELCDSCPNRAPSHEVELLPLEQKMIDALSIAANLSKTMKDGESLVAWVKRMSAYGEHESELREALEAIHNETNPDNPESYRADDREGCFDFVFETARAALQKAGVK